MINNVFENFIQRPERAELVASAQLVENNERWIHKICYEKMEEEDVECAVGRIYHQTHRARLSKSNSV
jgi:hypothetical protein